MWSGTVPDGPSSCLPLTVGAGFTGSWYEPAQSGHGFLLQIVAGQPMQFFASWLTFAPKAGQRSGSSASVLIDASNVHEQDWGYAPSDSGMSPCAKLVESCLRRSGRDSKAANGVEPQFSEEGQYHVACPLKSLQGIG
jgi:hypothetical protein